AKYKAQYEWLKKVDSLALANAQLNLQTAIVISVAVRKNRSVIVKNVIVKRNRNVIVNMKSINNKKEYVTYSLTF
ncbi:hypothetical protein FC696_25765, partial [Bacillus wiedmannii]